MDINPQKYKILLDKYDKLRRCDLSSIIDRALDWNTLFLRVQILESEKRTLEKENKMLKEEIDIRKKRAEQTIKEQLENFISENLKHFNLEFPPIKE